METEKDIGLVLEKMWIEAGYESLGELCKATGITVATLSRIKNNIQKPSPATLKKLAPALKVPHEKLMELAGYISNNDEKNEQLDYDKEMSPYYIELNRLVKDMNKSELKDVLNFAKYTHLKGKELEPDDDADF